MKIITGLAFFGLMTNVAFSTAINMDNLKSAQKHFYTGTFKGKTDSNKECTVSIAFEKEPTGSESLVAKIFFYNYRDEFQDAKITLNNKRDNLSFWLEQDDVNVYEASLSKSKIVHQQDDYQVTAIQIVSQYVANGKLDYVKFEWIETDYENDPHEDQIICNIR